MRFSPSLPLSRCIRSLGLALATALLSILLGFKGWNIGLNSPAIVSLSPAIAQPNDQPIPYLDPNNTQQQLQQGRDLYQEQQFAQAVDLWTRAEQTFASQGNVLTQATTLSNLALAYRQQGNLSEAKTAINKSLSLLGNPETLTDSGLRIYAQALNTQGSLQLMQGQTQTALATWEKATDSYRQANYPEGIVKSLINQTHALRNLGFFRQSNERLLQIQTLLEGNAQDPLSIKLHRSLGDTYRLLGELEQSKAALTKSASLAQSLQMPAEAAATLLSLGNTQQVEAKRLKTFAERTGKDNDYGRAIEQYERAYQTYAGIDSQSEATPLKLKVQARLNQLDILSHQPSLGNFQSIYTSLQTRVETLPPGRASLFAHIKLADLLSQSLQSQTSQSQSPPSTEAEWASDRTQQTYRLLSAAKAQAQTLSDPIAESYALGYLGRLYESEGSHDEAQKLTAAALQLTQQPSVAYQWQWQLGKIEQQKGHQRLALEYYDAAFRNAQLVRNDLLYIGADIRFDFRDRIDNLYREYIGLLLPSEKTAIIGNPKQVARRAQTVIDSLRVAELESFLACGLLEANNDVKLASIQEVAKTDQKTAIIYPIILKDRLEVLFQKPDKTIERYPSWSIPTGVVSSTNKQQRSIENSLEDKLERFRQELERPYFSDQRGQPLAEEFYERLIQPAEDWLKSSDIETLVFVLDGAFRNVPMAALYDRQTNQFLIEKYAIAVTFGDLKIPEAPPQKSFQLLAAGLSKNPQPKPSEAEPTPVDIFGPLFEVINETQAIASNIRQNKVLLNHNFTKERIATNMRSSDYNIVHFATHGEFGFTRNDTYLLAADSPDPARPIEGDKISLNDLDTLLKNRNATPIELLVLSACETATGDDREVLGIAGLAIQSGAKSTLATLWSIHDASTAVLMEDFYNQLITPGISKAKALQAAQITLLKRGYKPSRWAPYLLLGDWR
ncbi:MAG: CHAT domain-containing protein [Cyanobacteria bacterium J06634_5]